MSALKTIRQQYGWTQARMARYLDISRSLEGMVELDKRALPAAAFKKLNALAESQAERAAEKLTPAIPKASFRHADARRHLKKLLRTSLREARVLETRSQRYTQTWLRQQVEAVSAEKLSRLAKKVSDAEYEALVSRLANDINKKIATFNPLPFLQLELKLSAVRAKIAAVEALLKMPASKWFQLLTDNKHGPNK